MNPTDSDQHSLLAAAQAGDELAFQRLVEPYRHALQVHCYRMLGSTQDAEDLVQETLLRAWRALDRFEPRAQFQTWLYRIATNACLDELQRRPRRPELIDPFPDRPVGEAEAPVYDPAARYAESTVASVNSALQRARATVEEHLPAPAPAALEPDERELLSRYIDAFERDDVDGLVSLLREDAVLRMPPQPSVIGAQAVVRFFRETAARGDLSRMRLTPTRANGRPAVVVQRRTPDGGLAAHGVLILEISGGTVAGIDAFINPALLPRFGFSGEASGGRS